EDPPILGQCWRFPGSAGYIGIRLHTAANLTAVSLGYPPREQLSRSMSFEAPKLLKLWGLPANQLEAACSASSDHKRPISDFSGSRNLPERLSGDDALYLLTEMRYAMDSPRLRQVFPVGREACTPSSYILVVVEVVENWGAEETCVYSIGLHGD
ncbi:hypothetical protein DFP72DRAFT_766985, partial [Ephemerocybe angulata]